MPRLAPHHHRRPLATLPVLVAGLIMLLALPAALVASGPLGLAPHPDAEPGAAELSLAEPLDHVVAAVRDGAPRLGALSAAVLVLTLVLGVGSQSVAVPARVVCTDTACPPRRARRRAPPRH